MYVFIDDSGDPGFKFDKGSSRFFVIACCVFETAEAAELTSERFRSMLRQFLSRDKAEFKFSRSRQDIHRLLLAELVGLPFHIHAVLIDKRAMVPHLGDRGPGDLYRSAIARTLSSVQYSPSGLVVFLDGRGDKSYIQGTRVLFSQQLSRHGDNRIRKLRSIDSRSSPLIQLADLFAGTIRRSADESDGLYRRLLEPYLSGGALTIEKVH